MVTEPYKVNDDSKKSYSFRPLDKNQKSNIQVHPFIPDKIRVSNYLKEHTYETNYYNLKNSINNSTIKKSSRCETSPNKENDIFTQPIMKFKPRTDLERVIESVNFNNNGKANPEILKEQLKKLGLSTVYQNIKNDNQNEYSLLKEKLRVNPETYMYLLKEKKRLEKEDRNAENERVLSNINNIIRINKEIMRDTKSNLRTKSYNYYDLYNKKYNDSSRKDLNNQLANKILEDYQKKTHFKALCTCSLDLKKSYSCKKTKINPLRKKQSYSGYFNFDSGLCKKSFKQKIYEKEKLEYLKTLYKAQNENSLFRNILIEKQKTTNDDDNDEQVKKILKGMNTIKINGVSYKKTDLPKISEAVLQECNYFKRNSGKENAGEGKTMITEGLTVNEFTRKYKLPK